MVLGAVAGGVGGGRSKSVTRSGGVGGGCSKSVTHVPPVWGAISYLLRNTDRIHGVLW